MTYLASPSYEPCGGCGHHRVTGPDHVQAPGSARQPQCVGSGAGRDGSGEGGPAVLPAAPAGRCLRTSDWLGPWRSRVWQNIGMVTIDESSEHNAARSILRAVARGGDDAALPATEALATLEDVSPPLPPAAPLREGAAATPAAALGALAAAAAAARTPAEAVRVAAAACALRTPFLE